MLGDSSRRDITWYSITRVLYQTPCKPKFLLEIMNLTQSILNSLSHSLSHCSFTQKIWRSAENRQKFWTRSGQNPMSGTLILMNFSGTGSYLMHSESFWKVWSIMGQFCQCPALYAWLIHISTDVSPRWGPPNILQVVQPLTKTNPHTTLVIRYMYINFVDA